MIIVSQDKKTIVNFDNVIYANVRKLPPNEIGYAIRIYTFESDFERFALYDTEERAKEVLQEIVSKYSSYLKLEGGPAILQGQIDVQPNIFNIPKVYYMPKE